MNSDRAAPRRVASSPIGYLIVVSGLIISALSIDYQSSITAFIGISLVFWGSLLLYIQPRKYVSSSTLNAVTGEQMLRSHLMYDAEGYSKPVFKAETSLENMSEIRVTLRRGTGGDADKSLEVIPIGLGLHILAEKELRVNFNSVSLKDLRNPLIRCFVETLEVADSIRLTEEDDTIVVEVTG